MDANVALAAAQWLMQVPWQVVASIELLAEAISLSTRLNHPAYDCFYLALARQNACALVTADKRLIARCQQPDASDLAALVVMLKALEH